ncbi:MAG: hypothetical protein ACREO4_09390 [Lysobacter sp.]
MWATAIKWLFGTAMGRGVLMGGSIAIGMALGWYAFSTHYYNAGVASCQAGRATDTNAANVAQGEKNIADNETASSIGKAADEEAAKVIEDAEQAKEESKESIHDVYKKPPVTAPVVAGSCVHPLDDRVQDRISKARAAAVAARGTAR